MNNEELMSEIKRLKLPTFGTKQEKIERLKKYYGINKNTMKSKDNILKNIEEIKKNRDERREKINLI